MRRSRSKFGKADAQALAAWANALDSRARLSGVRSGITRSLARAMVEHAMDEVKTEAHRGGHRHASRRALMPWELDVEAHTADLIEAALRGRLTGRTGALARSSSC